MDYKNVYNLCIIELQLIFGIYKKNKRVFYLLEKFKNKIKRIKKQEEFIMDNLKIKF
jgi:hypothetical protein